MPGTSAYIQISRYALIEYQYNSESIPLSSSISGAAGALRLYNKYIGSYQFLNTNQSVNLTGNVLDRSAGLTGTISNRWAYFDIDSPMPIYDIDSNFEVTNQTANLVSIAGKYDTVRLHILSGFDFPGLDGLILQLRWKQWQQTGSTSVQWFDACNHVYLRGQDQINFNSTPLFLGDRMYDRYIEVKVPSLYDVNQDFWNSPTATNTIGYNYTFNNVGFLQNSQIYAVLHEIDSSEVLNGNLYLNTGNDYTAAFNTADNYSQLAVVIQENAVNDYIEFYPTWNGAFIENYINDLNSIGGDWVVINQIDVYEQVGTSSLRTSNMTMLQDNNFDQPAIFRPVILNASIAYSYTVDYTMRFFNRVDNTEVVRKSSYTSTDAKKYGKQLEKINLLQGFTPVKVFNKITQMEPSDTESVLGLNTPREVITQKVVVPTFYDTNMISLSSTADINTPLGSTIWPQGFNIIYLGKFDNMIKFKVFTLSTDKTTNVSFDMSSFIGNVALAFNTTDNNRLYVNPYIDINLADPSMGEVVYRIDPDTATKILASADKNYYLVNKTDPETVLYVGKFDSIENKGTGTVAEGSSIISSIDSQITGKNEILAGINQKINEANAQLEQAKAAAADASAIAAAQISQAQQTASQAVAAISNQSSANAALLASLQAQAEQIQAQQSVLTQAQAAQQAAIQQAAQAQAGQAGGTPVVNIVEIPGVANFSMPSNFLANLLPNSVVNPSSTLDSSNKNPANQGFTKML
jgi:hypothetical protein